MKKIVFVKISLLSCKRFSRGLRDFGRHDVEFIVINRRDFENKYLHICRGSAGFDRMILFY